MYIIKNALKNLTRSKVRNLLIGIIIVIITISSTIALLINNSSEKLVENYTNSNPIQVTFNLNMMEFRGDRKENEDLTIDSIDEDDIKNYGDSKYVKDYYYTYQLSLSSDDIDPIDFSDIFTKPERNDDKRPNNNKMMSNGDFKFVAYSDVSYIENFIDGTNKIKEGKIFTNDLEGTYVIISSDLALENELEVGDKIKFYNPSDEDTTYEFEIYGIYEDSSTNDDNFMNMNAMNSQNEIYVTLNSLKEMISDDNNISAVFYLNSSNNIEKFEKEVKEKGLSEYYQINNNLDSILETLEPIENISNFSMTFLIIILIVGAIIIAVLNSINIRERKYEIGILRAIGMNKIKVTIGLITELFIVAIISFIIGVTIGGLASQPITNKMLEKEINNYQEETKKLENNFGNKEMIRPGFSENKKDDKGINTNYVDNLKVKLEISTIIKLFGMVLLLTLISGLITIVSINKYEPNKILQNRT